VTRKLRQRSTTESWDAYGSVPVEAAAVVCVLLAPVPTPALPVLLQLLRLPPSLVHHARLFWNCLGLRLFFFGASLRLPHSPPQPPRPTMAPKKKGEAPAPKRIFGRFSNSLKMGIVGLPNVGKSSFFNALANLSVPAENYPFCTIEPSVRARSKCATFWAMVWGVTVLHLRRALCTGQGTTRV